MIPVFWMLADFIRTYWRIADACSPHGCGLFRCGRSEKQGVSDVADGCGTPPSSNEIPTKTVRTAVRKDRFSAEKPPVWQCKMRAGSAVLVPESCGFLNYFEKSRAM